MIELDLAKEKKSENEEIKNKGSDTKTTSNINSHLETIIMMLIGTILFIFSFNLFMCGWLMDIDKEMFHLLEERRRITKEVNYVDIDGFANVSVQTVDLLKELITRSGGFWNGREKFIRRT